MSSAPGATNESSVTGSAIHEFDVLPWLLGSPIIEVELARAARLDPGRRVSGIRS